MHTYEDEPSELLDVSDMKRKSIEQNKVQRIISNAKQVKEPRQAVTTRKKPN